MRDTACLSCGVKTKIADPSARPFSQQIDPPCLHGPLHHVCQARPSGGAAQLGGTSQAPALSLDNLRIGSELHLFNRRILLVDADPYTKQWLKVC